MSLKTIEILPTIKDNLGHRRRFHIAECSFCGNQFKILAQAINKTKSCGCVSNKLKAKASTKHGFMPRGKKIRIYQTWADMRQRCNNPNNPRFHRYGGRCIKICSEWDDFAVFKAWADSNGYNDKMTIDRIDNDKGYNPENCKWVTIEENIQNRPKLEGEAIYCSKLKEEDVLQIRELYKNGVSQYEIAKKYDTKQGHISNIIRKKIWRHI